VAQEQLRSILATDVGSTTTKAILIEKRGEEYRLVTRGEMPTTVEAPWENVMIGVRKAVKRVEELVERPILDENGLLIRPRQENRGVDYYVSTSSAGGGLQMMVAGLVTHISADSAHRAALGAGAVVLDVIAVDDGRSTSEQITRITHLRPDIILMSGGVDGGSVSYLAAMAETIVQANPQPRFGATYKLPLVYAGNKDAADLVDSICEATIQIHVVENVRPRADTENLGPAREAIHDLFMNHVMAQAPGYGELMKWVDTTIMPTPGAVGYIIQVMAREYKTSIIGVDIGGATTDVFSEFAGTFTRTVSANLGMSYSICNVYEQAGYDNIRRWVPFEVDQEGLSDWISNKMVRPTTIPQTMANLILEQALAREALRLSFAHHKQLARKVEQEQLSVVWRSRQDVMKSSFGTEIIDLTKLGILVGSGGVLSHAPRRNQAALLLLDSFQPECFTQLAVDSIFMMPHLGVLASTHPAIAAEVFDKDCLLRLGTSIAPSGPGRDGRPAVKVKMTKADGAVIEETVNFGDLKRIPLGVGETATVDAEPVAPLDLGAGKGRKVTGQVVYGGLVGLIIDCRGRPLVLPEDDRKRAEKLVAWIEAMDAYPMDVIRKYLQESPVAHSQGGPVGEKGGKRGGLLSRVRR
jgi:uncharacterized protein (TIGR01319 family)